MASDRFRQIPGFWHQPSLDAGPPRISAVSAPIGIARMPRVRAIIRLLHAHREDGLRLSHLCLWPRPATRHARGSQGLSPKARCMTKYAGLPAFLPQNEQYSSEYLMRRARHAVFTTLYFRAQRIWSDGVSCLLDGLCKNVSFSFTVVVVICVLVRSASEIVVLAEEQFQGFSDHVGRRSIDVI